MHGITDISVDDCFVIHILDNRLPEAEYSQALTPMPEHFRTTVKTYLLSLMKAGFKRKRFGRFQPDSPVRQAYHRLTHAMGQNGKVEASLFLDISKQLASQLFRVMRQSSSLDTYSHPGEITPGDLLVGLFYAENNPYVYLIKVNLESALQRQKQAQADGSIRTVLLPCPDLIPRLNSQHIQKTAIIRAANDPETYEVIMTDPQGGKEGVAKFFAEDFLGTEPFYTADQQAELLFQRTHMWVVEHEDDLSPTERQGVLQTVRSFLTESAEQADPVSPRDLIRTLPLSEPRPAPVVEELRQSFEETLTVPDGNGSSIPADRELLIQNLPPQVTRKRVTYELDHGVQLSGDEEAIQQLFANPPHRVREGTEFTIRTSTFRPVL